MNELQQYLLEHWERLGVAGIVGAVGLVSTFTVWRRTVYLSEALRREQRRHTDDVIRILNAFVTSHLDKPASRGETTDESSNGN